MAVITFPTLTKVSSVGYRLITPAQINRSGWTGRSKVVGLPGAEFWRFEVGFQPARTERQVRELRAFVAALRGVINTTYLPVLPSPTQYGLTGDNSPNLSAAAAAGARAIVVTSVQGFAPGVVFSASGRLHIVTSVVGSTINFEPSLSVGLASGVEVYGYNPICNVRIEDPEAVGWVEARGQVSLSMAMVEAL